SVHLLDGKKICSATCFSKNGLKDVEKALADKSINKFDFFKMKYGRYRKPMIDEVLYHKYSTNHLLPITAITLFIIPVIMYVMWFIKFS
nr:hypothetical protein [Oscillospiraceae bacterium]